jgi:hypothetical protein
VQIKIEAFSLDVSWWAHVPIEGRTTRITDIGWSADRHKVFHGQGKESCWFGGYTEAIEAAIAQPLRRDDGSDHGYAPTPFASMKFHDASTLRVLFSL